MLYCRPFLSSSPTNQLNALMFFIGYTRHTPNGRPQNRLLTHLSNASKDAYGFGRANLSRPGCHRRVLQ